MSGRYDSHNRMPPTRDHHSRRPRFAMSGSAGGYSDASQSDMSDGYAVVTGPGARRPHARYVPDRIGSALDTQAAFLRSLTSSEADLTSDEQNDAPVETGMPPDFSSGLRVHSLRPDTGMIGSETDTCPPVVKRRAKAAKAPAPKRRKEAYPDPYQDDDAQYEGPDKIHSLFKAIGDSAKSSKAYAPKVRHLSHLDQAERLLDLAAASQELQRASLKDRNTLPETDDPDTWAHVLSDATRTAPRELDEMQLLDVAMGKIDVSEAHEWTNMEDLSYTNPERFQEMRRRYNKNSIRPPRNPKKLKRIGGLNKFARQRLYGQNGDREAESSSSSDSVQGEGVSDVQWSDEDTPPSPRVRRDPEPEYVVYRFPFEVEFRGLADRLSKDRADDRRMRQLIPMYDACSQKAVGTETAAMNQRKGLRYFDMCFQLADQFEYKRSPDQQIFHDAIFQTCSPHIVGKENYQAIRDQLLDRFGRNEPNMAAMILCPRRWGKTTATAMAIAVLMYVCRGINILVFSTGQAMSTTFMQLVSKFFLQLPNSAARRIIDNSREFGVSFMGTDPSTNHHTLKASGKYNKLSARSGSTDGNIGLSADIFVLEEAAAIPPPILRRVIAPMLKVSQSVLLALSTHQGKENYYTKLFQNEDPIMDRLFIRKSVELMCKKCKAAGADPSTCTHLEHLHPPWLLSSNAERVKVLMGDDEKLYAQEVLNVIFADANSVFDDRWINALMKRPRRPLPENEGLFVLTFIDPAGGGASQTGICSIVRSPDGEIFLVGLDEFNCVTGEELTTGFLMYFKHFNQHAYLRKLPHIVCVENNYGGAMLASSFVETAKRACPKIVEHRTIPDKPGVVTTRDSKCGGVMSTAWDLHKNRIHIAPRFASLHYAPDNNFDASYEEGKVLDQFDTQMKALHKESKGNTGAWHYTAKTTNGGRDDMLMCFMMAGHYSLQVVAIAKARSISTQ